MAITTRFTDYTGDFETLREVSVIGPYDSEAERDADIKRLAALPGMSGSVDFEESELDTDGVDTHITPSALTDVTDLDTFLDAAYG